MLLGLTVTAAGLMGGPYTGASINPARSLAPVLLTGTWDVQHWIYWAGPMVGGALGGLIYRFVFMKEG